MLWNTNLCPQLVILFFIGNYLKTVASLVRKVKQFRIGSTPPYPLRHGVGTFECSKTASKTTAGSRQIQVT